MMHQPLILAVQCNSLKANQLGFPATGNAGINPVSLQIVPPGICGLCSIQPSSVLLPPSVETKGKPILWCTQHTHTQHTHMHTTHTHTTHTHIQHTHTYDTHTHARVHTHMHVYTHTTHTQHTHTHTHTHTFTHIHEYPYISQMCSIYSSIQLANISNGVNLTTYLRTEMLKLNFTGVSVSICTPPPSHPTPISPHPPS